MSDKNPLTEKLRPYVEALKADALSGNKQAQAIIELYQMHVRCPNDPGAPAICGATFDEWLSARAA